VINVYTHYRELDSNTAELPAMGLLAMQADWLAKRQ
jgi:hypothetical protein